MVNGKLMSVIIKNNLSHGSKPAQVIDSASFLPNLASLSKNHIGFPIAMR